MRTTQDGYRASSYASSKPLCAWPGCRMFSVTQIMTRNAGGSRVDLCTPHRTTWDALSMTDIQRMPWQKRRSKRA